MVEYDSKTVGATTQDECLHSARLLARERKYPVLYLLHGIGGDETEWQRFASPMSCWTT